MTMPQPQTRRYTVAEYVRFEERSNRKHEFHDGEILAMSGGSFNHGLIATNFNREIGIRLKGNPCRVVDSNVRISTPRRMYYPDGSVICGPPEFDPRDPSRQSVTNPRVIIEVLSPSTESYDRGEKFDHYGDLASLEEYILVAQDRPRVETLLRQPDGSWNLSPFVGLEATALIRTLRIEVPLAEIYSGVVFPPPAPPPDERERELPQP